MPDDLRPAAPGPGMSEVASRCARRPGTAATTPSRANTKRTAGASTPLPSGRLRPWRGGYDDRRWLERLAGQRHGCRSASFSSSSSRNSVGLVLVEVARVHELAGEDLLGLREHLLLAGRQALVGVADGEVAHDLGDLEDVAGLELVAVVLVATAPVLGHLGGVAAQDVEDLVDDVGRDDLAQTGAVGVLDRDHDRHVVVEDLDGEVLALLAEHFLLLDLHDLAGAVMRIDDLIADLSTRLSNPPVVARGAVGWPVRRVVEGDRQGGAKVGGPADTAAAPAAVSRRPPAPRRRVEPGAGGFGDAPLGLAARNEARPSG